MKRILCIVGVAALLWGNVAMGMSDKELGKEAAAVASKLLNKDTQSPNGMTFYMTARAIIPDNDSVLLIQGYLDRGKAPIVAASTYTPKKLAEEFRDRAVDLLKNQFKRNGKVAKLALLYLRVADQFLKNDPKVVYGISYLQAYGFTHNLNDLTSEKYDLTDIFRGNTPPAQRKLKLSKTDVRVAKEALGIGTAYLAKDSSSLKGLTLVRFSIHLQPDQPRSVDVLNRLQRGMAIEAQKATCSEEKLLKVIISRAKKFAEDAKASKTDAHMAQLYFRIGEKFLKDDREIILGLVKLEQKLGEIPQADDLLNKNIYDVFESVDDKDAGYAATKTGGGSGGKLIGSTNAQETAKGEIDGARLRIDGKTHRVRHGYDGYQTSLRAIVTNYVGDDVSGLTVECYIIGKAPYTRKAYFIAEKKIFEDVLIKKRNKYEGVCSVVVGSYAGFLIIVKDSDGKVLNKESKDDFLKKNAEKIMKYRPSPSSSTAASESYYYSAEYFDNNGDKTGN